MQVWGNMSKLVEETFEINEDPFEVNERPFMIMLDIPFEAKEED